MNLRVAQNGEISSLTAELLASQEGLCSMDLVNKSGICTVMVKTSHSIYIYSSSVLCSHEELLSSFLGQMTCWPGMFRGLLKF